MTNPTPHGQVPEALRIADEFKLCSEFDSIPSIIDIEKAEAELRRQHTRIAALESELEAIGAGGVQALSAAPGVTSEQRRLIGVIADKIEDGTLFQSGIYPKKDLARFVRNMLDTTPTAPAASPTPPAEQQAERVTHSMVDGLERGVELLETVQARLGEVSDRLASAEQPIGEVVVTKTRDGQIVAVTRQDDEGRILSVIATSDPEEQSQPRYSHLHDADAVHGKQLSVYSKPPAEQQAAPKDDGFYEAINEMDGLYQAAPKAATGVGNSGFDYKTAADFLNGKTVSDEAVRKFVAASRWAHDERAALSATLLAMHGVLTSREAEIALLKKALLEAEAAPQPAPAPLSDDVVKDAARYRWLREGNDAKHSAAWHVAVNLYGCEWDAAIDAARAAPEGK